MRVLAGKCQRVCGWVWMCNCGELGVTINRRVSLSTNCCTVSVWRGHAQVWVVYSALCFCDQDQFSQLKKDQRS